MRGRKRYALLLAVLVGALAIGLSIACSPDSGGDHSQWPGAVAMMKILPADIGEIDYTDCSARPAGWWEADEWKEHYGETFIGQSWSKVHGMAMMHEPHIIWLIAGDLDLSGLREVLGTANGEMYQYEGTTVWKGESYSTAIVNQIVVTGEDEQVKRCIDAASDKLPSMYEDRNYRWVANSLPKGTTLAIWTQTWGNDPNLLVQGVARDDREGYHTEARAYVYDYGDADNAATQAEEMTTAGEKAKAEGTAATDFRIEQDGQYVLLITFPLV
jgi:hypothetical protein